MRGSKNIVTRSEAQNYSSKKCNEYKGRLGDELGDELDLYNIYSPLCHLDDVGKPAESLGSVKSFGPCADEYVFAYLNLPQVQHALHARKTSWKACGPTTVMPMVKKLSQTRIRVWIGDVDGILPVTYTRNLVNKMKLPLESSWRPWYCSKEIGGYVVRYKGVVLTTVRGAGHAVPSDQPERALVMISAFLQGLLPPTC
nr:serine carboxypeptidase II-3-like isoform X1 [Tanacetum cinerariifolium]